MVPYPLRSEAFAEDLVDGIDPVAPRTERGWAWLLALAPLGVALLAVGIVLMPPLA
ncbi:MAG: hypothetical protein Fur0014_14100 [Rubrivivax sp.]